MGGGRGQPGDDQYMQEFMFKMMMGITKGCFISCVNNFKDGTLATNEIQCIKSCSFREVDAFQSMNQIQSSIQAKYAKGGSGF